MLIQFLNKSSAVHPHNSKILLSPSYLLFSSINKKLPSLFSISGNPRTVFTLKKSDLINVQSHQSSKHVPLGLDGLINISTFQMFLKTQFIIKKYCKFYSTVVSTSEENICINHHAIYCIIMNFYFPVSFICEHFCKINFTFRTCRQYYDLIFLILWSYFIGLPNLYGKNLVPDLISSFLMVIGIKWKFKLRWYCRTH